MRKLLDLRKHVADCFCGGRINIQEKAGSWIFTFDDLAVLYICVITTQSLGGVYFSDGPTSGI